MDVPCANLVLFTPPRQDENATPSASHAEREVAGDVICFKHSSGGYIRFSHEGDIFIVPAPGRRVSVGEPKFRE